MSIFTKREKVYYLTPKMYVFNLDLSSLIFLKSGRETEKCEGGWQGKRRGGVVQPIRTTDRYKIRAVIPTAKQRAGE